MTATKNVSVVEPYLFFNGRCEEAVEFYQKALGAKVDMLMLDMSTTTTNQIET